MEKKSDAQWSVGWNYLSIPKLQQCNHWSLGMDKQIHPTPYTWCDYLSMNKRAPDLNSTLVSAAVYAVLHHIILF